MSAKVAVGVAKSSAKLSAKDKMAGERCDRALGPNGAGCKARLSHVLEKIDMKLGPKSHTKSPAQRQSKHAVMYLVRSVSSR